MKTTFNSKFRAFYHSGIAFLLSILSNNILAQDIIVKNDSSRIQSQIEEINPTEIKYKLFNYTDGPKISISRAEVAYIRYKNGQTEQFTKTCSESQSTTNNKYNLDSEFEIYKPCPAKPKKDCEKLYSKKNYIGVNYLAFLNTGLGFNFMHDFREQQLILNVPIAFGLGKPNITNTVYRGNYLGGYHTNAHYNIMRFQGGVSLLFSPGMKREVNFLIGPSFLYHVYNVDVNTKYSIPTATTIPGSQNPTTQYITKTYKNNFNLYRQVYGMSIGFLARFSEHINMNALLTLGLKNDTYNKQDPYGLDYIESQGGSTNDFDYRYNAMPYANLAISIGYRF